MSRRIVLGKVNTSDHGLFVSKTGQDIVDGSGNLTSATNQLFNSKASSVGNFTLLRKGQLTIAGASGITGTTTSIAHGQSFRPLVFAQWCFPNEVSSGVATKMRTPYYHKYDVGGANVIGNYRYNFGLEVKVDTTNVTFTNYGYQEGSHGSSPGSVRKFRDTNKTGSIHVAYLIFATSA
mgnify:CR=1 FL=1|tara:strand:- start:11674 stop:12210 length:537 start_codon:yes stop_codon:yes gene_type:complete